MKPISFRRLLKAAMSIAVAVGMTSLSSCHSIYEDEGDCTVHYRIAFRYTKNILNADAFASQVSDIHLYLIDSNGKIVFQKTEQRKLTTENNYYIDVDVFPGTYDILAWCEGQSSAPASVSFNIAGGSVPTTLTQLGAELPLTANSAAEPVSSNDIKPLFYGFSSSVEFPDSYGTVEIAPVSLTKDTNHFTVTLQNIDGHPIDPALLSFSISGCNSQLSYANELTGNTVFAYTPWYVRSLTADFDTETRGTVADGNIPNGVQIEMTTGRLFAGVEQTFTVTRNDTGEEVLRIPLVQYLLLIRGYYEQATSNQDYLDRVDNYSLVFFIEDGFTWVKSKILINNWRIVPPQIAEW